MNQSKQKTLSFIVCRRDLSLGHVFSNFLLPCTPSAFHYMSMYPLNAEENNKNIFTNKHLLILKIIFTDVDLRINTSISK